MKTHYHFLRQWFSQCIQHFIKHQKIPVHFFYIFCSVLFSFYSFSKYNIHPVIGQYSFFH